MGNGTQANIQGDAPWWSQTDQQGGMDLANPVSLAREHFANAREQFNPILAQFRAMQPGPEKAAARPGFEAARNQYDQTRDWFAGLRNMTPNDATGFAALGPPRPWAPAQLAPTMPIPQFPGMPRHDGTIGSLLAILQKQQPKFGAPNTPPATPPATPGTPGTPTPRPPFNNYR